MNSKQLLESALVTFDQVGYQLDQYGIASNINRHEVIAYLMAEQKRVEGELDSIRTRIGFRRLQAEKLVGRIEGTARDGFNVALKPARYTLHYLRGILGNR